MADGFEVSVDDAGLSASLGRIPARLVADVYAVVTKGALNIKEAMREDAEASTHFRKVAQAISFDQVGLSATIGPEKRRAGNLANIAYFGGAHGGGGTVRDPQRAADEEAPRFEKALLRVIDGLL